jgi:hypothetical protein
MHMKICVRLRKKFLSMVSFSFNYNIFHLFHPTICGCFFFLIEIDIPLTEINYHMHVQQLEKVDK